MISTIFCFWFGCFSENRLSNLYVGLTNTYPNVTRPTIGNYPICAYYPNYPAASSTTRINCATNVAAGRFLIIQLSSLGNDGILTLCEVQVFEGNIKPSQTRRKLIYEYI